MEYTNLIQPLLCVFLSLTVGIIIGALYMFFKTKKDIELMEIDLEICVEQSEKTRIILLSYMDKYGNDDYESY